ncbi:hypothetical protein [Streptomyces sp. WM6378]|uniref:hypothetical protein n=1 Tax=Streptomyces sp. WM6378 TaxID=1415557 RepID=UPI001F3C16A8|nr:hypothetical protein [Streptomyces sp. WM6378]
MISDEAKTSMYASIANCTSGVPARNDADILGTAVLMMELSADTMKRLRYAVPTTPKVRDLILGRLAVSDMWFSIFSKGLRSAVDQEIDGFHKSAYAGQLNRELSLFCATAKKGDAGRLSG